MDATSSALYATLASPEATVRPSPNTSSFLFYCYRRARKRVPFLLSAERKTHMRPPCTQGTNTQQFYSSQLFNAAYPVPTLPTSVPPGSKWAAKRFENGIYASADNERFKSMKEANRDDRPFMGIPYAPSNTFVTTGKAFGATYPPVTTFPAEEPVVPPKAPEAPKMMSLSRLLASR